MTWHSDSPEGLQEQLNGMFEYCKKWHMIVSLMRTKVLVFNKKNYCDVYSGRQHC